MALKKILAVMAAAVMSFGMFTACGSEQGENDSDTTTTTSTTTKAADSTAEPTIVSDLGSAEDTPDTTNGMTFVLGFDASFPPYGYMDENGEYTGFDIDLAKEVCARRGWTLELRPIDWDAKDFELSSGSIDCIWNGFTINGREEDYLWSDPYVDNSQVIVVAKDSGIETLADLEGKLVEVQADSSALAVLTSEEDNEEMLALAATFKELKTVPEYNTAFIDLESGAADAIAMDIGVAKYQIESRGGDAFVILEEQLAAEQYGIGFALENTELRDLVQETLDEMMADGKFMEIATAWGLQDSVIVK